MKTTGTQTSIPTVMNKRMIIHRLKSITSDLEAIRGYVSANLPPEHTPAQKPPRYESQMPGLYERKRVTSPGADPDPWAYKVWSWSAEPRQQPLVATAGHSDADADPSIATAKPLDSVGAASGPFNQRCFVQELLMHGFGFAAGEWTHTQAVRVSMILVRAGWRKRKEGYRKDGGTRREYWIPPLA